jgi:hypothetical protein
MHRFIVMLAASAALAGVGQAGPHAQAAMAPAWVRHGVVTLRGFFPAAPAPERFTWGTSVKGRWVTIFFARTQISNFPTPPGGAVKGRRATISWAVGSPAALYTVRIPRG